MTNVEKIFQKRKNSKENIKLLAKLRSGKYLLMSLHRKIFRRVRLIRFGIDSPSLDKSRKLLEEWPHAVDVHLDHNAGLHDAFQLLLEVAVHPG